MIKILGLSPFKAHNLIRLEQSKYMISQQKSGTAANTPTRCQTSSDNFGPPRKHGDPQDPDRAPNIFTEILRCTL